MAPLDIPTRTPGNAGHVNDHNVIVAAINGIVDRLPVAGDLLTQQIADGLYLSTAVVDGKVGKGDLVISVKDHGALGNGAANDTAAIDAALAACSAAGGGIVYFPPGDYNTQGGHVLPAGVHMVGSDRSPRYYGLASTPPPSSCSLVLIGTAATWMIKAAADMRGSSICGLSLAGNNIARTGGGSITGLDWSAAPDEQSFTLADVSITGFRGDGWAGRLSVVRVTRCTIGGNRGWGLRTGTSYWTDTFFDTSYVVGNTSGGLLVDGTNQSGLVQFTNVRFERAGWDPATNGLAAGATAGGPGIRLVNAKDFVFDGCSTDANSGNGVHLVRTAGSGKNVFRVVFIGCNFNRDGWGAGGDADPSTQDYSAVRVEGTLNNSVDGISWIGCSTGYGKPRDDGVGTQLYPRYGVTWSYAFYPSWIGGKVQAAQAANAFHGGAGGWSSNWRPVKMLTEQTMTLPAFSPGAAPTPLTDGDIWWDPTAHRLVTTDGSSSYPLARLSEIGGGGGGAPTGPAGGDLTGSYPNPDLAPGVVTNAEIAAGAAIALTKLATDPLARGGHTGTQLAATISDLTTAVRANRLDQFALPTAAVSMNGQRLTNLAEPTAAQDAATKSYVDALAQGLDPKASVRAATTGPITLSGPQTIDTVSVVAGDRVLVKNQTSEAANGIYVAAAGAWSRAADMDAWAEVAGAFTFVEQGTANQASGWVASGATGGTLDTTAITWTQFSGAGTVTAGTGLAKTGNVLSIAPGGVTGTEIAAGIKDPAAATAGLRTLGTGAAQAAAGNDARLSDTRTPTDGSVTDAKVASGAAIALTKLAVDPRVRGTHTGTQLSSTISDLPATIQATRLDQFAAPTAAVALNNQRLTGLAAPAGPADAVTKAYADSLGGGGGGGANQPLNAKDYLFGDGRLESDAAVNNLMAAWLSSKKSLYWPAGNYWINAGLLKAPFNGATMYGDGVGPTVIIKASAGVLFDVSGTDQNNRRWNVGVRDLTFYGENRTGTLMRAYYTTLLYMERVLFSANNGIGLDAVQLWDSTFVKCDWENVNSTTEYAITIRSSAATTGFGTSTDNSNAIRFYGCRVELFKAGAISITRGNTTGNNSHDITFAGLKCETSTARGPVIKVDDQSNMVMFSQVYVFVGGYDAGYATPINAIDWAPWGQSVLRDVAIACSGNFLASGVLVNGADDTVLDNVQGEYAVAPTSGYHVNVGAGVNRISARAVLSDHGTAFGPAPVSYAPTIPAVSAGGVDQDYVDVRTPLSAKVYLKGDGTLEIDSNVTAMVNAWGASKKTLHFPAGTYLINSGLLKFPVDGLVMRGDGRDATIIKRNNNGVLLDCSGTNDDNYRSMISYKDMRLHGGDKTGSLVRCYYTKHMKVRDVWHYGCNGPGLEGVALWDSYFDSVDWEWNWSTTTKAIVLRNSNATSGFGFSADTTNALRFVGCRWETFANGAVLIEAGTGSTSNPHDIIFIACKMESGLLNGGPNGQFIDVAPGADDIVINRLYVNVGGLGTGGTKLGSVIRFKPAGNCSISDLFLSSNGDFIDLGMEIAFSNKLALRNIRGKYTVAPTSGNHVSITGGCADFTAQDVTSNFGVPLAGTPTSWAVKPGVDSVVQAFAANGTWTKPVGAKSVTVVCIGGGGGGGGGRRDAAGTVRCGGGGGGGAGRTQSVLDAAALGNTEAVVVGVGGVAGAAATADTTSGGAGGSGGTSTFGSHVRAGGGNGGGGGTASTGTGGTSGAGLLAGGAGGTASVTGAAGTAAGGVNGAASGGGSGGGITAADAASAGGAGIAPSMHNYAVGAGGAIGTVGGTPATIPPGLGLPGSGAGGGGSSITGVAGSGGAGNCGSGGGGGGGSLNGNNSGAGGVGGAGLVIVTTHF